MTTARQITLPAEESQGGLTHGSLLFIGTATVLLQYAGFRILTDPNFLHRGQQVRLGYGLRSRRQTNPALEIDQLPPLDLVLVSHLHEDHFDRVAEQRLDRRVPIVTTTHAAAVLSKKGFRAAQGLQTWQRLTFAKGESQLHVTAMPGQHARGPLSALLPPVMGTLLEFEATGRTHLRIYITGDTLLHAGLAEIRRRYPEIDLAVLHLGGTRIFGLLLTMDGRQGAQAIRLIRPRTAIPIHYDDYPVFKSSLDDFRREVSVAGLEDRVRYVSRGETYHFQVREDSLP